MVLAVALAVALVAASAPALDRARVDTADQRMRSELIALRDAATALRASSDPTPPGEGGARATVTVTLPRATWGRAVVERLEIGSETVSWRVEGGTAHTVRTEYLHGRAGRGSGPLVLTSPGRARLTLRLVQVDGRETVVVRRTFIPDDGPRPGHVSLRTDQR